MMVLVHRDEWCRLGREAADHFRLFNTEAV